MTAVSFLQQRTRGTFFTSLISISLVLFFLTMFLGAGLFMRQYLRQVQEAFEVMVIFSDDISGNRQHDIAKTVSEQRFSREVKFVSKEDAANEFMDLVGEDFLELLDGINPMHASFKVRLKAEFLEADSLARVKSEISAIPGIVELRSPDKEIIQIRRNSNWMIRLAGIMGIFVIIIAWFLIGGTIRLAVYARRFSIRTMQLIGATNRFIRRPFLRMGVLQGFFGGLLASGAFFGLGWWLAGFNPRLVMLKAVLLSPEGLIMLGGIVILGAVLGYVSSTFAVNRFLNQSLDNIV